MKIVNTSLKTKSKDIKHYEELLANRINEEYADKDPAEWLYVFDGGPFSDVISGMAQCWDEVRALVEALEDSHRDDEYDFRKEMRAYPPFECSRAYRSAPQRQRRSGSTCPP